MMHEYWLDDHAFCKYECMGEWGLPSTVTSWLKTSWDSIALKVWGGENLVEQSTENWASSSKSFTTKFTVLSRYWR